MSGDGGPQIAEQPPRITHVDAAGKRSVAAIEESYRVSLPTERRVLLDRFRLVDVARKVVGVGSVGTRCYVALLLDHLDEPLFLQIKEARRSVWDQTPNDSTMNNQGKRVVIGQRVMQATPDVFLGWTSESDADFYVRQLLTTKRVPRLDSMSPRRFREYASLCALALARGHARSGRAAEVSGYVGRSSTFPDSVVGFAIAYADQTERDHLRLLTAINDRHFTTAETIPIPMVGAANTVSRGAW